MEQLHVPELAKPGIQLDTLVHIRENVSFHVSAVKLTKISLKPTAKSSVHNV
jgi:hypothetical protein